MTRRRNHTRKGFNLIESAIVLGVVGFVIGGIWYAAAAVQENRRVTKTLGGTLSLIEGVRRLNHGFTPNTLAPSVSTSILESLQEAGVIPQDVFAPCDVVVANSCDGLWGYNVSGMRLYAMPTPAPNGEYYMQLWAPKTSCIKIGMALSGINFAQYQINRIVMSPVTFTDGASMTLSNLQIRCTSGGFFKIYFNP